MAGPAHEERSETSRLAELMECELELERLDAEAGKEAAELVSRARGEADRDRARVDSALTAEVDALRARLRQEAGEEVRRTLAEAQARVARLDEVPEAEVERLADIAFRVLLGGEPA